MKSKYATEAAGSVKENQIYTTGKSITDEGTEFLGAFKRL